MFAHRLRRWPSIGQTLGRYVVFAGMACCKLVNAVNSMIEIARLTLTRAVQGRSLC